MLKREMCSASDSKMLLINKINMLLIGLVVIVNLIVNITPGGRMGVYWVDNTKWKGSLNQRNHQRGPQIAEAMEIVLRVMTVYGCT